MQEIVANWMDIQYHLTMALHKTLADMLSESLPEFVAVAEDAINTPKPGHTASSYFGYPACALLFSIADAIGGYCANNDAFKVTVDGKLHRIGSGEKRYFVLNGKYYGLALSGQQFKSLYNQFRGPLTHNAAMVPGVIMDKGEPHGPVFYETDSGDGLIGVSLNPFLAVTKLAVERFLMEHHTIVPASGQWKDLASKARID